MNETPMIIVFDGVRYKRMDTDTKKEKELMTRKDVAKFLGVHVKTVERYDQAGLIESVKFSARNVRYPRYSVIEFATKGIEG